jgi:hypothetical protein
MDRLLKTMYTGSRDREKREALESVMSIASRERGAYVNGGFTYPLTFILLMNLVYERPRSLT